MSIAYSLNDEEFRFDNIDEVMECLEDDDKLIVGSVYYAIDTKPVDLAEYLDAADILEQAEERAYDDLGEVAEDAMSVSNDSLDELDAALKAWAAKYLTDRRFWRCVGESRALIVTADDVSNYARQEGGR